MKKLTLTLAIVLGMAFGAAAQQYDGGLFKRGPVPVQSESNPEQSTNTGMLSLPSQHGQQSDASGDAPLGSGIALLIGLGGAYAFAKRQKEQ